METLTSGMRELLRALSALALYLALLVVIPVGVTSAEASSNGWQSDSVLSFCGYAPDGHASHGPCHACRAQLPALVPPCDTFVSAWGTVLPVRELAERAIHLPDARGDRPATRAPPRT